MSIFSSSNKNKKIKNQSLYFSYDEEIGCIGIRKLIPFLKKLKPKPKFCLVGEPTEMKIINQHKGKKLLVSFRDMKLIHPLQKMELTL